MDLKEVKEEVVKTAGGSTKRGFPLPQALLAGWSFRKVYSTTQNGSQSRRPYFLLAVQLQVHLMAPDHLTHTTVCLWFSGGMSHFWRCLGVKDIFKMSKQSGLWRKRWVSLIYYIFREYLLNWGFGDNVQWIRNQSLCIIKQLLWKQCQTEHTSEKNSHIQMVTNTWILSVGLWQQLLEGL